MTANQIQDTQVPHAIEAEQAVLGAILLRGNADRVVRESLDELASEMFYSYANRTIFAEIEQLENPDFTQIMDVMRNKPALQEIVPFSYLTSFRKAVVVRDNLHVHVQRIKDAHMLRQLITLSTNMGKMCLSNESCDSVVSFISASLKDLNPTTAYEPRHISAGLRDYIGLLEKRAQCDESVIGIKTGLVELDRQIVGLGFNWLVVLAGRPSHGKSLVAQIIANHISKTKPVVFFSMEMSEIEILDRELCLASDISPNEIRSGQLKPHQWEHLKTVIADLKNGASKFYIDTTPALSINQICARVKAFVRKHPDAGLIQVDYLGLMKKPDADRNDLAIAAITSRFKELTKEVGVPVMLLVQCNRAADTAKRLTMSNLADSASIERDADLVLFTHKDSVANPESQRKNIIELSGGKFRHGSFDEDVWLTKIGFKFECMKSTEIEEIKRKEEPQKKNTRGLDL